nr:MAG TPA: hypothetical protein [Caudoviricetes sp.]
MPVEIRVCSVDSFPMNWRYFVTQNVSKAATQTSP